MKKISILTVLLATVLLFGGCRRSDEIGKIDENAARSIALAAVDAEGAAVHIAPPALCERNGLTYYRVEITVGGVMHEIAVDAVTGVIIEQSDMVGIDPSQSAAPAGTYIGEEAAYDLLLTVAGFTQAHAYMTDCILKQENGRWQYEITFVGVNQIYLGKVDAVSGEVLSCTPLSEPSRPRDGEEIDGEMNVAHAQASDPRDPNRAAADPYDVSGTAPAVVNEIPMSVSDAKDLVLSCVPGATQKDIVRFDSDATGILEYRGTVIYQNMSYQFAIDPYSGAIRSWTSRQIG